MYKEKVVKALERCKNIKDVEVLEEKITHTEQINRRTIAGRALTLELLDLTNKKAHEFINNGEQPF